MPQTGPITAHVPVVVVGGGACGLTAALAARDGGADVLVLERDRTPRGTTAMSTGLIPAAGSADQRTAGIDDSPEIFAADVMKKAHDGADPAIVDVLARGSAETIDWLRERHGVPLGLITGFLYPGHSRMRMMGTPHRTGEELMAALLSACGTAGVDILTDARVAELLPGPSGVAGVVIERPDGSRETITTDAVVLACCGFAGNPDMVARFIPEMLDATFHGHPGNKGDAIRWGEQLGAQVADMDAYQGHAGLAYGHAIPILWPLIMEGGVQVNAHGQRFANEALGYSEQAVKVVAQPGRFAWSVYDARLHQLMLAFDDYQQALRAGAVVEADTIAGLARLTKLPEDTLAATLAEVAGHVTDQTPDRFGRVFAPRPVLTAPFHAAKVCGALFHTQGGLVVDTSARVLRTDGTPIPNLYAGGGAARGISGRGAGGYIAGNGLVTATGLGKIAGRAAAALVTA
jgi:fumarate reductase flavoprotein subunit